MIIPSLRKKFYNQNIKILKQKISCAFYEFDECLTKRLVFINNKECKELKDS
jgi:hypothetical protein